MGTRLVCPAWVRDSSIPLGHSRLIGSIWAQLVYPAWARGSSVPLGHELVYPSCALRAERSAVYCTGRRLGQPYRGRMARDSGASSPISPNAAHRRAGGADCLEALNRIGHRPASVPQATDTPYSCCSAARLETDEGRLESRSAGYSAGYDRVSAHLRGGSPAGVRPLVRPLHRLWHPGL